jgi:heme/copper-type cytochrome/quinol oxidase subunit 2
MPDIASTADPVAMTVAVVALLIALGVLVLLVLVLVGIRHEERHMSLTSAPRTRIEAITRHLTGVGVRTPEPGPGNDQNPSSCPERHLP